MTFIAYVQSILGIPLYTPVLLYIDGVKGDKRFMDMFSGWFLSCLVLLASLNCIYFRHEPYLSLIVS